MNRAKIFIVFTFLLAFAVCVSAQGEKPKIVWKNLQEQYLSFYDIKPTIVNVSDKPIYFNCSMADSDAEYFGVRLTKNVGIDAWQWNVWKCGTLSKDQKKKQRKEERRIEKLKKEGKYIPAGCRLNPNEEFTFDISQKNWSNIIVGDEIMYEPYKSGKFRFELPFEWIDDSALAYSPEFSVLQKEETK